MQEDIIKVDLFMFRDNLNFKAICRNFNNYGLLITNITLLVNYDFTKYKTQLTVCKRNQNINLKEMVIRSIHFANTVYPRTTMLAE